MHRPAQPEGNNTAACSPCGSSLLTKPAMRPPATLVARVK